MPDASAVDSSAKILEALGQLKTGGLILVGFIAILGLVAWIVWLRNRRAEKRAETQASLAESAAKEKRADRYTTVLQSLRESIDGLRTDSAKSTAAIQNSVSQQTTLLTKSLTRLEEGHAERQTEIAALMRELLDRQKGVINIEDSLRIVELNFRLEVKPSVLATVEASIRNNHFDVNPTFVQERYLARINTILFNAHEALKFYALSVDPDFFFPADDAKHYELANTLWETLKAIHSVPANLSDPTVMATRIQQAQLRTEDVVNSFVNAKVTEIRSNNDDNGIQKRPAGTN